MQGPSPFCGIALRRLPSDQLAYTRRNGKFLLEIAGHPRFGLPYGQDRLIPIWVATLALKQKSRVVHFDSAAQMLDFFCLPKDGPHPTTAGSCKASNESLPRRRFTLERKTSPTEHPSLIGRAFTFFDRMQLWFSANEQPQLRVITFSGFSQADEATPFTEKSTNTESRWSTK